MVRRWVLTVLGPDRPGIVAGTAKVLFELGCNLEDSAMTRLEGEFAIMVIFTSPARLTEARLGRAVRSLGRRLKLAVHLKRLTQAETIARRHGAPYGLSVYGADRPGIVYRMSSLLARLKVNITDVTTHRTVPEGPRKGRSLYLMVLEVELPSRLSARTLEGRLRRLAQRLRVEVTLRPVETQVL